MVRKSIPCIPFVVLAAAFFLQGCGSSTQTTGCFYTTLINQATLPEISIDPLNFEDKGGPRLDIVFKIPYRRLGFTKNESRFTANYTVTVRILDDDGTEVAARDWSQTISLTDYRGTISDQSDATLRAFPLPAGKYTIIIAIQDDQTQQRREFRRVVTLRGSEHEITASDIVILQHVENIHGMKVISPMLPMDIGKAGSFGTFMEVYDSTKSDTIRVRTQLIPFTIDIDQRVRSSPFVSQPIVPTESLFTPKYDTVYAEHDTILVSDGISIQLFNTFLTPPPGRYQLVSQIMHKKPDRIDTLFYGRILNIRSEYFPDVVDIDNQIPPLRYLLRKDDFDSLNAPGTRDERTKRLDRIWSTTLNPTLRQDFYARVRQANEYFTTFVDGWQTPMGMVYIVAGPPSDVDCQGGLNESWYYDYHQGYAVFIFQTNAAPSDRGNERSYYSLLRYPTQDVWEAFMSRWRQ